jgi:Spy/CpxP family protein refolding chaperone
MRRTLATLTLAAAFAISTAAVATADPSFGPGAGNGQGNNQPHDAGAKCHPPGQTTEEPGCK